MACRCSQHKSVAKARNSDARVANAARWCKSECSVLSDAREPCIASSAYARQRKLVLFKRNKWPPHKYFECLEGRNVYVALPKKKSKKINLQKTRFFFKKTQKSTSAKAAAVATSAFLFDATSILNAWIKMLAQQTNKKNEFWPKSIHQFLRQQDQCWRLFAGPASSKKAQLK